VKNNSRSQRERTSFKRKKGRENTQIVANSQWHFVTIQGSAERMIVWRKCNEETLCFLINKKNEDFVKNWPNLQRTVLS